MSKLSLNLVVMNEIKYLPFLISSLKQQSFKDFEMIIVDNASDDGTPEFLERELTSAGIKYSIEKLDKNVGFAAGHNLAYKKVATLYFAILNPDMYLSVDVFEKLVAFMDHHINTASAAPRLMRWDFEKVENKKSEEISLSEKAKYGFTDSIDAIGIRLLRNRRAVEFLTGEKWSNESISKDIQKMYSKTVAEIFGVSGALAIFRTSILNEIALFDNCIFDQTYHSYKEDLDLAYRLRIAGYVSYVLLDVVVYHDRTGAGPKKMWDLSAIKNRKSQSRFVRFHSYKNHLRTLYKNEYWQNFLLDFPFIFWYELKKFLYILFTSPAIVFQGVKEIVKTCSYMKNARKTIRNTRKMYWKGLRRWF